MSGRHEAPLVGSAAREATAAPYVGKRRDEFDAMRGLQLCRWCQDRHFRPYPEQAASSCNQVQCECWCTQGTGQ